MDDIKLVFVYNADSGLFNTMADIGHKLFSPQTYQCDLCTMTHGYFQARKEWKSFIDTLDIPTEFLHRDEFRRRYTDNKDKLPAVFVASTTGLKIFLPADAISQCNDLDGLQSQLKQQCLK